MFLDQLKDRFFKKYSVEQANTITAFGINFKEEMQATMEDCNNNPDPDKAKAVIADLVEVKNVTAENLSNNVIVTFRQNIGQRHQNQRCAGEERSNERNISDV